MARPPSHAQPRTGRGARRGRTSAEGGEDRCTMCGAAVTLDVSGRCPLGHQVLSADEVEARGGGVAAEEPAPAPPSPGGLPPSFSTPAPQLPQSTSGRRRRGGGGGEDEDVVAVWSEPDVPQPQVAPAEPITLPSRLTEPLAPRPLPPHRVLSEDMDEGLIRTHASNAAAFAAMVAADLATQDLATQEPATQESGPAPMPVSETPLPAIPLPASGPRSVLTDAGDPATDRIAVSDLTPAAASSLDIDDVPIAAPAPQRHFEQEPLDEGVELEPSRGVVQQVLGVLFVAALVMAAWWLATGL